VTSVKYRTQNMLVEYLQACLCTPQFNHSHTYQAVLFIGQYEWENIIDKS